MNRLIVSIAFYLLIMGRSLAQDIQISSVSLPESFNSTVVDISQDPLGNIWMATTINGAFKYNGQRYVSYHHNRKDANTLISDRLECIYADRSGIIWIGSFSSGLSRFDPATETFRNFIHDANDPTSIRSNNIRSFTEDNNGGIWIGTVKGVDYWNPVTQSIEHQIGEGADADLLAQEHVRVLYTDSRGTIWAGSSSPFFGEESEGGLFRIDPKTKAVKLFSQNDDANSLTNNTVTAIFEDSRGTFWVGTAGDGLHTMDRELGKFQNHSYDPTDPTRLSRPEVKNLEYVLDHIKFFEEDKYGRIWIGTMNNGINRYDPNTRSVLHLNSDRNDEFQLPNNGVWASLKTNDDLLWITGWSPRNNSDAFFKANLDPLNINFTEMNAAILSIVEGNNGHIYMGSTNALFELNMQDEIVGMLDLSYLESISLNHINKDSDGHLWIATDRGLLFYNTVSSTHELFPVFDTQLSSGTSMEVVTTDDISPDSILVGTINGLYLFDAQNDEFSFIDHNSDFQTERANTIINTILIDSQQKRWIGYGNHGLRMLNADLSSFKDYSFLETVQDGPNVLYEDDEQIMYVGNWRSGLRMYHREEDRFSIITDKTGVLKSDAAVGAISKVSDSILWVITRDGPIQYDLSDDTAINLELDELRDYQITNQGLFSSSSGDYYLGTRYGYIKFRPEDFESNSTFIPSPKISKLLVGNEAVSTDVVNKQGVYELGYQQNNISFRLSYVNFLQISSESNLQYLLENHDQKWRLGANDEEVFYFKLPPGSYKFQLRAEDNSGGWVEDSVSLIIAPPWWKTWWAYSLYGLLILIGGWLLHKFQKERTIRIEREKNQERELAQAKEIEKAYTDLQATQAQLVQSEKMASLGELTAGIAHEIQNPLNFVNNFSEVNIELLEEIHEEIDAGNYDEVKDLANDIRSNQEKIAHHGKRADGIVKSMLKHTRTGGGDRVETDINNLCDEYLRLAYHGMRAKNKSFNAEIASNFDNSLPKVKVIRQDIGRVLLNLMTNAFQAMTERQQSRQKADVDVKQEYQPILTVSTDAVLQSEVEMIQIKISDNGLGIPQKLIDKIFQPFFTTKPTGSGTGLGLSISYDIAKAHGGELSVESEVGRGTEFVISLPI